MRHYKTSLKFLTKDTTIITVNKKQYTVLERGEPVVHVDSLELAIEMVRNFEARNPLGALSFFTIVEKVD